MVHSLDIVYCDMGEPSPGSSHKGTKIHAYTSSFKLRVVTYAKVNNNSQAAKQFAVSRTRVIRVAEE